MGSELLLKGAARRRRNMLTVQAFAGASRATVVFDDYIACTVLETIAADIHCPRLFLVRYPPAVGGVVKCALFW